MTISEMHTAVKLGLDKSSALELPAFEPEEIDFWLNKAIMQFVKTRYSGSNIKQESFEQTQKRIDDIRSIVTTITITPTIGGITDKPNSYIATLPSTPIYLHRVGEEVNIQFTDSYSGTTKNVRTGVTECTNDTYNMLIDNPFSEHILYLKEAKPLSLTKGNTVELVTDGNYSITAYYLTYIKQPATVSITAPVVSCDLPSHTHHEIVDICVAMLLENIENNRYQSFKNETMVTE